MERLSIRAAVFLGFGLIFGLWLFAWMQLSWRITKAQDHAGRISAHYGNAQEALTGVRAHVMTASVIFRDALLDPNPDSLESYLAQIEETFHSADELLDRYVPVMGSRQERDQFARLRDEVSGHRSAMLDVLASDRRQWVSESLRVRPRRDAVIAISESIQTLNRSDYVQQQAEIAGVYRSVQRELWQLLGLALAIGIGVAVLAVAYAGRLERRLRQQMARDLELAHDLQDLSARLVNAQEEERRHLARELHDEIGQALTAIKVELALAQRSIEGITGPTTLLKDAESITDGALHQVRDLSYLLRPAALDELGLIPAVDSYVKAFAKRHGIRAELVQRGQGGRLSGETEGAAYRIIQEALTNVAKHARAQTCLVRIACMAETLQISIEDNGTGFDQVACRAANRRGLGLIGIRERVSHLHGTVVVESAAGRGTRIVVELPVQRADSPAALAEPAAMIG